MLNPFYYLFYLVRLRRSWPRHYADLLQCAFESRCSTIVDIGTYQGIHARHLIQTGRIFHRASRIRYFGFDLFETQTKEQRERESSPEAPCRAEVEARLQKLGVNVRLYAGNTRDTLPAAATAIGKADLVVIDGGHSFDTVESDWNNVRGLMHERTVVVFDDYYPDEGFRPPGCGCQKLIDALDRSVYDVKLLPHIDEFPQDWGTLRMRMVRVSMKAG